MELDQKSIAIFLHLQGKNKKSIYTEMKLTLQDQCISYSTITKYIRNCKTSKTVNKETPNANFDEHKIINEKILYRVRFVDVFSYRNRCIITKPRIL